MNEVVFDASAMLALLHHERGEEKLTGDILARSVASTVNLAEVQTKLVKKGYDPAEAWDDTLSSIAAAEPFTSEQAKIAGSLIAQTEKYGLSLGDRSCLALAIALLVWLPVSFSNPVMTFSYVIFTELLTGLMILYVFRRLALGWSANGPIRLFLVGGCIGYFPWIAWRSVPVSAAFMLYAFVQWWRAQKASRRL